MAISAPYPRGLDAHTHLDFGAFDADLEAVLARSRAAGVHGWVIAAADPDDWDRVLARCRRIGARAMLGVHPWWASDHASRMTALARYLEDPEVVGVGETGLDHARARTESDRAAQLQSFRAHLALARERDLPVALHCVRAYPLLLETCARDGLPRRGGLIHAWSGARDHVPRALSLGLHISLGPLVLRSRRVQDAARHIPLERLLLETDCPDWPLDGDSRGEPADLRSVAGALEPLFGLDTDAILDATGATARGLLSD